MADSPLDGSQPVVVGRILGTHGLSGAVKARVLSDVPHRFDVGQVLYIRGVPHDIASSIASRVGQVILKFQGIDSLDAAQQLAGEPLTITEDSVPALPEGEYFHFQLLGLQVLTEEGEDLGEVREILETGSNDVYVVSGGSGEVLVPALAEVVREVRLAEGVMVVRLPGGLR